MVRKSGSGKRSRPAAKRHYPRTARLNTLFQEIAADALERVEDDRLELVTVTGVEVDADLNRAVVYVSALTGPEADAELLEALSQHRLAVQRAIGSEARVRKTPEVIFAVDPAIRTGARIEEILAELDHGETSEG
jgi:ribosome-binding factor A